MKICLSYDPKYRLRYLQSRTPVLLWLRGKVPGTREDEKYLHLALRKYKRWGEWFKTASTVNSVASLVIASGRVSKRQIEREFPALSTRRTKKGS